MEDAAYVRSHYPYSNRSDLVGVEANSRVLNVQMKVEWNPRLVVVTSSCPMAGPHLMVEVVAAGTSETWCPEAQREPSRVAGAPRRLEIW